MTATEMALRLKGLERDVDEHDKILVRGNGKPSLQEDVRTILKFISEEEDRRKWTWRLMITLVLGNLVGLGVAAFMWFVKIYPVIERLSREAAMVMQ